MASWKSLQRDFVGPFMLYNNDQTLDENGDRDEETFIDQLLRKALAFFLEHYWDHDPMFGSAPRLQEDTMIYLSMRIGSLIRKEHSSSPAQLAESVFRLMKEFKLV